MALSKLQRLSDWDYVSDVISINLVVICIFFIIISIMFHAFDMGPGKKEREQRLSEDKKTEMELFVKLTELNLKLEGVRLERDQWEHEMNRLVFAAPADSPS
ncbi:hypothetical protein OCU04_008103 [Sclerotinia nivalis]|uniref:Uncharacterized protein n=1 Tax=Sclerotinia nivalis TaxID=352851 RepID=A0A9X0AKZ2_9HELO|nr:hypothetical protein OCU04_008103 [Sclerotinia nivalis]